MPLLRGSPTPPTHTPHLFCRPSASRLMGSYGMRYQNKMPHPTYTHINTQRFVEFFNHKLWDQCLTNATSNQNTKLHYPMVSQPQTNPNQDTRNTAQHKLNLYNANGRGTAPAHNHLYVICFHPIATTTYALLHVQANGLQQAGNQRLGTVR